MIDGDTIEIHDQRIRLFGIDAPESSQLCACPNDKRWRCGASRWPTELGAQVRCQPRDIDRYRRVIAVCFSGSADLNRW